MEKIRQALEIYRQEKGYYPAAQSDMSGYVTWPVDPKGFNYVYSRDVGTLYAYSLYGAMEVGTTISTTIDCAAGIKCNYQMKNP
jgi:hypothetical protein